MMRWLDESPDVKRWVYEPVDLCGLDRSKPHRPDFQVWMADGSIRVIEGKSRYYVERNEEDEMLKARLAQRWADEMGWSYITVWHEDVERKGLRPRFQPMFSALPGSSFHTALVKATRRDADEINALLAGVRRYRTCECGYLQSAGSDHEHCPVCGFSGC